MDAIEELLGRNRDFAAAPAERPPEGAEPGRRLAIVTCMDTRVDPYSAFGLRVGEAHVIRNAGGVVSDDVIRSLAISQRKLGTREVMIVHHTECGMLGLSDDGFRAELAAETGTAPPFAIESFDDLEGDVRQSVLRVRRSPFIAYRERVRGFVYDVGDLSLREVEIGETT